MDLSINYLGLKLAHPFMPGSSPMAGNLDTVRKLEDAGASAIVMNSLFEEELIAEQRNLEKVEARTQTGDAEARSFLATETMVVGPQEYLGQLQKIKQAVKIPVLASLNGVTAGGWLNHARLMQEAGADALELNVYHVPTDKKESAQDVEDRIVTTLREMRRTVKIPVAVKLLPFHTALPHLCQRLVEAGANGLVLFNRFYVPDINVEELAAKRSIPLSTTADLPLRLMWLSIIKAKVDSSLAVSGGVHTAQDAIKSIMCGASAVQMVSALLSNGPAHLAKVREEVSRWLEQHEYASLQAMHGNMALDKTPDPAAFDRRSYMQTLHSLGK
jgi:dihydroorotate dehydrogenase (fumarate)